MLKPGETIQSQYATSAIIRSLIDSARVRIAPDTDIELFYDMIFNIETAQGKGLDIWGRILGMERSLEILVLNDYFGFDEADFEPFNVCPFWDGEGVTDWYSLTDDAYRQALMWKAMANIATADAATLNSLLLYLFPGQDIVIHEVGIMEIELYIFFPLQAYQRSILKNYGLMAKGAGVQLNWVEIPTPVFGFSEADYEPFDTAPFWATHYTEVST